MVALNKPNLNNQVDSKKLTLFRYGVTQILLYFHCSFLLLLFRFYNFYILTIAFYSTDDDFIIEKLLLHIETYSNT